MPFSSEATRFDRVIVFDLDDTLYLERDYVLSGLGAVGRWARNALGIDGLGEMMRARFEAGWRSAAWRVNLDADAKRMYYLGQTVGSGIATPTRITDDYETTLRVERDLNTRWSLFGEHRWERSRSNESEFSYRANTVLAGIQRSF